MPTIKIDVAEKKATAQGTPRIVCGNSDYAITFTFDSEWNGYATKTARFAYRVNGEYKHQDIIFTGTTCKVPALYNIAQVAIGVYAGDIHTTTPVLIPCDSSITCRDGKVDEPSPDVYAQLMALINTRVPADNAWHQVTANSFKGTKSGEVVRVDDVSPLEHVMGVKVRGKNLFDVSKIANTDTATNNGDGSITIAANTYYCRLNQKLREVCPQLRAGDTAVLSFVSTSTNTKYMYFHGLQGTWNVGHYITLTDEILDSYVTIYGFADTDASYGQECVISNIQIEIGKTVTDYTPYTDPSTMAVTRSGRNLLNPTGATSTLKGLTFTNNGDGSFTIRGTSTGAVSFALTDLSTSPMYLKKGKTYTQSVQVLSGTKDENVTVVPAVKNADGEITWNYLDDNQTRTAGQDYTFYAYTVYVNSGVTVNLTLRVQLEVGDKATEYTPYVEPQAYTPYEDGTVEGVTSLSPTVTLLTDTEGVTIDLEYNRDTTAVMGDIAAALDSVIAIQNSLIEGASV